jgi:hypothetical protein
MGNGRSGFKPPRSFVLRINTHGIHHTTITLIIKSLGAYYGMDK